MSQTPSAPTSSAWSTILTFRSQDQRRMESVRVQLSGKRIKANGRIVAAETDRNPAFAAYYDLLTDETGATKRLGMTVTLAERERQLVVARDDENVWLITGHHGDSRATYDGALDVDLAYSPFFNTLPIRRNGLHEQPAAVIVPTVYITLPEMSVAAAAISYNNIGEGMTVHTPLSNTTLTVDNDGFIVDYPDLAERI